MSWDDFADNFDVIDVCLRETGLADLVSHCAQPGIKKE